MLADSTVNPNRNGTITLEVSANRNTNRCTTPEDNVKKNAYRSVMLDDSVKRCSDCNSMLSNERTRNAMLSNYASRNQILKEDNRSSVKPDTTTFFPESVYNDPGINKHVGYQPDSEAHILERLVTQLSNKNEKLPKIEP